MRLGLRLTARQTEDKSTEKAEDRPTDTTDGATDGAAGPDAGDETADKSAGGDTANAEDGQLSTATDAAEADDGDLTSADGVDKLGAAADGDTAELDKGAVVAGAAAGGDTAELDDGAVVAGAAVDGEDTVQLDKQDQTVSLPAAPGTGATRLGREMAGLGVGVKVLRRWGATVARLWQSFARLWQPGPGIREAAEPGGRTFAMVTILPALLLIAWLLPGLVLLLANRFLPAPMVLISVPVAVALAMLAARHLPGRWPILDTKDQAASPKDQAASLKDQAASPKGRAAATKAVAGTAADEIVAAEAGDETIAKAAGETIVTKDQATATKTKDQVSGTKAKTKTAAAAKAKSPAWAAWWGLGGTVVIAVAFAAWQLVVSSPQFIVSRDPGAYAQVAYWIADHGVLPIPASLAAFGGAHPGLTFASFGFASHGTAVVPGVTAGLPIVLAAGMWVHGVTGASVMSPLLGAFAILAVGGLTGRLAGPQWAPAGAFLLALTIPEIYTSRSAFSETLAQALLFGGLCLVVDSFSSRRPLTLAVLGGAALGLTVLAGTGLLLVLLPIIPVAGALLAGRRPQAIPFIAGLVAGVVCGLAAGIGLDFPAVRSTTPSFALIGILAAGLVVLTALGVTVGLAGPMRRRARKLLAGRPLRWLPEVAAVLVLAAATGLAARPYIQKVHGPASPYVAALQRLESLPIDPGRLYAENSLYWVIWYLGVPALLLGVIGLAMVTRQCLRALITWRDASGADQAWALPVAIIGWGLFAVLWQPNTVPDQPWASRRLVPVVLPGLVVLAVWVAAWLIGRAHARGAGLTAVALATACFVVALAVPPAAITFGIELSRPANPATRTALSGLAFRRTGAGQVTAVERLCGAIPRHSSVLLLDKVAARAFTQVIRGTCDVPAGVVTSSAPGEVNAIIGGIERAGRHPALLASRESELVPYGPSPTEILNLATQQDSHLLTRPPTSTWPVHYTLWMSAPGGTVNGS